MKYSFKFTTKLYLPCRIIRINDRVFNETSPPNPKADAIRMFVADLEPDGSTVFALFGCYEADKYDLTKMSLTGPGGVCLTVFAHMACGSYRHSN